MLILEDTFGFWYSCWTPELAPTESQRWTEVKAMMNGMNTVTLAIAKLVAELGLIIQREAGKVKFMEAIKQAAKYHFSGNKISREEVVGKMTGALKEVGISLTGIGNFALEFHLGLLCYQPPSASGVSNARRNVSSS